MTTRIIIGDCREALKALPDGSVNCCITSPPYWGLRSYLPAEHPDKPIEIGSEPTLQEWVDTMVAVFREVRRVLRDDGTLWLNLGDSYSAGTNQARKTTQTGKHGYWENEAVTVRRNVDTLKPKDLMGQPWRVAFALQADGWWLRQEIIWAKPNPMPESITDRFTKAHEHVFLLSKSSRYHFDFDAVQEPVNGGAHARRPTRTKTPDGWDTRRGQGSHGSFHSEGREAGHETPEGVGRRQGPPGNPAERKLAEVGSDIKSNTSFDSAVSGLVGTRNPRSVWTIPSEPFKGAHFATFPTALAERCIRAGCPVGGVVLDPFGGSGTVGLEADRQHKDAILIDLDERNEPMARGRILGESSLYAKVETWPQD